MTKEELIIDGVNIKECPHRNSDCPTFMNIIKCYNYGTCEGQNCLYKQLQKSKEENEKLTKILQELEDLSLKTYDVADFQMYFDKLRGKNDD